VPFSEERKGKGRSLSTSQRVYPFLVFGVLHQRAGKELRGYDYILVYIYSSLLI
jgi:hypothetical protein